MNETLVKGIIENADWEELNGIISDMIGKQVTFSIGTSNKGTKLTVESDQDFKDDCGVMSSTYKTLKIENFGTSFYENTNSLYFPLVWAYTNKSNGNNCQNLVYMFYYFDERRWAWEF